MRGHDKLGQRALATYTGYSTYVGRLHSGDTQLAVLAVAIGLAGVGRTSSVYDNDNRLLEQSFTAHTDQPDDRSGDYTLAFSYYQAVDATGVDRFGTIDELGAGQLGYIRQEFYSPPAPAGGIDIKVVSGTSYAYDYRDAALQSTVTKSEADQQAVTTLHYDANGHLTSRADSGTGQTTTFRNNVDGQVLQSSNGAGITHNFFYANGQRIGDVTNSLADASRITYDEQLKRNARQETADQRRSRDTTVMYLPYAGAGADFDQNFEPVNDASPGNASGSYTVRRHGETLRSIAQMLWGDSSLWFLIAEANGLLGDAPLAAGQVLRIPSQVTNVHNNAGTWRPYNAADAIGSTDPHWTAAQAQGIKDYWRDLPETIARAIEQSYRASNPYSSFTSYQPPNYDPFGFGYEFFEKARQADLKEEREKEAKDGKAVEDAEKLQKEAAKVVTSGTPQERQAVYDKLVNDPILGNTTLAFTDSVMRGTTYAGPGSAGAASGGAMLSADPFGNAIGSSLAYRSSSAPATENSFDRVNALVEGSRSGVGAPTLSDEQVAALRQSLNLPNDSADFGPPVLLAAAKGYDGIGVGRATLGDEPGTVQFNTLRGPEYRKRINEDGTTQEYYVLPTVEVIGRRSSPDISSTSIRTLGDLPPLPELTPSYIEPLGPSLSSLASTSQFDALPPIVTTHGDAQTGHQPVERLPQYLTFVEQHPLFAEVLGAQSLPGTADGMKSVLQGGAVALNGGWSVTRTISGSATFGPILGGAQSVVIVNKAPKPGMPMVVGFPAVPAPSLLSRVGSAAVTGARNTPGLSVAGTALEYGLYRAAGQSSAARKDSLTNFAVDATLDLQKGILAGSAGAATGAAAGAIAGSFIPVVGTAVGALVGLAAGIGYAYAIEWGYTKAGTRDYFKNWAGGR